VTAGLAIRAAITFPTLQLFFLFDKTAVPLAVLQ
jgi:hypothetical protein